MLRQWLGGIERLVHRRAQVAVGRPGLRGVSRFLGAWMHGQRACCYASTHSQKHVEETVSGVEISSRVKAKWVDPQTETIWVWVVPEP
jgi:hypothetical protein